MTTQGNTFAMSPSYLYTSESVTEGHPDKVCDQVSDSILDAIYAQDPAARVACETATGTDFVAVLGEITTTAQVDYEQVVRDTLKRIGYDSAETGIDYVLVPQIVAAPESFALAWRWHEPDAWSLPMASAVADASWLTLVFEQDGAQVYAVSAEGDDG